MRRFRTRLFVVILLSVTLGLAASSAAGEDYSPWVLLSGRFGDTAKSMGYQPDAPNEVMTQYSTPHAGVVYVNGKSGGLYRSMDCGETWEPVNGGRPWSQAYAGGYPEAPCDPTNHSCKHRIPYRTPPVSEPGGLDAGEDITWNRPPSGNVAPGFPDYAPVSWRGGVGGPYYSRDAGETWASLSMGCQGTEWLPAVEDPTPPVHVVAVDQGAAAHVVATREAGPASPNGPRTAEASGCQAAHTSCGERQIGWTENAMPQMYSVDKATHDGTADAFGHVGDPDGSLLIDKWSTWKYSTLVHLAAAKDQAAPASINAFCAVAPQPAAACTVNRDRQCHGHSSYDLAPGYSPWNPDPPVPEDGCLDQTLQACKCSTTATSTTCKYPDVAHIMIDPRNGYAYASTNVGLLVSPDGGRSWARNANDASPQLLPTTTVNPLNPVAGSTYIKQSTHLFTGTPSGCSSGGILGCDLNLVPQRIISVGKMSWSWDHTAACTAGQLDPLTGADNALLFGLLSAYGGCGANGASFWRQFMDSPICTKTGRLRAYLPVTWWANAPSGVGQVKRSSVFFAESGPCDVLGPLAFFDTRTVTASGMVSETDSALNAMMPRLPTGEPFSDNECFDPQVAPIRCPLDVRAIAVSASPEYRNVVYAIMRSGDALGDDSTTCPGSCQHGMDGVYRSSDGGFTWAMVLPGAKWTTSDPHDFTDIRVSGENPFVAWMVDATGFAGKLAPPATIAPSLNWDSVQLDPCSGSVPPPACLPGSTCQTPVTAGAHPACAYHFPSQAPGLTSAIRTTCVDCSVLPELRSCASSVASQILSAPCCMELVDLREATDAKGAVHVGRGNSGQAVQALGEMTLAHDGQNVVLTLLGGRAPASSSVGTGQLYTDFDFTLASAPGTPTVPASVDEIHAFATVESSDSTPKNWALVSTHTADGLFGLASLDAQWQAGAGKVDGVIHGQLFSPGGAATWSDPAIGFSFGAMKFGSRTLPHARLIAGPRDWLFASVTGAGVFAIHPSIVATSSNPIGKPAGVFMLPFAKAGVVPGSTQPFVGIQAQNHVPSPGPCVTDIAYTGDGYLWATVGSPDGHYCSKDVPPGI